MSDSLPPHRLVHGILQVRILEWAAFPFSSGSSWPRNRTEVSCIAGRFFTNWAMREALIPHIFKSYDDEPWFVSIFIHCAKDLAYNPAMWRPTIWVLGVLLYSFFGNFFLCSGIPVGQIDVQVTIILRTQWGCQRGPLQTKKNIDVPVVSKAITWQSCKDISLGPPCWWGNEPETRK